MNPGDIFVIRSQVNVDTSCSKISHGFIYSNSVFLSSGMLLMFLSIDRVTKTHLFVSQNSMVYIDAQRVDLLVKHGYIKKA